MAKSDTVRREKRSTAPDGRSFEGKYCGDSISAERSTFIRVKRLHGLSGPKESDGEPTSGTIVSQPRR